MSAVYETTMVMAHGFKQSLELGNEAQARVAEFVANYGWTTDGIGSIGNEKVPASYAKDDAGVIQHFKAPDLTIEKRNWPFSITIEVKCKPPYNGKYWIDESRLAYTTKWAMMKERLVLWVVEDGSKGRKLICASNEKLNTTEHREYNPYSTDRYGNPEPTWLFNPCVFVPFEEALEAQLESFRTIRSLHLPDETGRTRLI